MQAHATPIETGREESLGEGGAADRPSASAARGDHGASDGAGVGGDSAGGDELGGGGEGGGDGGTRDVGKQFLNCATAARERSPKTYPSWPVVRPADCFHVRVVGI